MIPPPSTAPNWTAIGICVTAAINIAGWFVVNLLAKRRERQRDCESRERTAEAAREARRRDFRAEITSIQQRVLSAQDTKLVDAQRQSVPQFMGECTKVEPDLCITKIAEFKGTRDAYCALKAKEIECPQQNQELNNNRFEVYRPGPHLMPYIRCDYEAGRRNIKTLLDTIIECAG